MKYFSKGMITRTIAVGLLVLIACVNPLQNLSPVNGSLTGAPVAKAAKRGAYVGEVRLAVSKVPAAAKQNLIDAGYEVIDIDLNQGAGDSWNSQGDQAVYMGIKRTDDESKAIRDMKTMNMNGKYSYSAMEQWVDENRHQAADICKPFAIVRDEFKESIKHGDLIAEEALKVMNHIIESDSGKGVGDYLLSDDCNEEGIIKVLVEGNDDLVSTVLQAMYMGCEKENDTWLERLNTITKSSLTKQYTRELYGVDTVVGEKKVEVAKRLEADFGEAAQWIYDNWDDIRKQILPRDALWTSEDQKLMEDDELFEDYMDFMDSYDGFRDSVLTTGLKQIPYGKKTLFDLFQLNRAAFKNDITRLYPIAAALTEGQKALLQYVSFGDLAEIAISRMEARKTGTNNLEKMKAFEEMTNCSLYIGVDRAMFNKGAAMTSRATSDFQQTGSLVGLDLAFRISRGITIGLFAITLLYYPTVWVNRAHYYVLCDRLQNLAGQYADPKMVNYVKNQFNLPEEQYLEAIENLDDSEMNSVTESLAYETEGYEKAYNKLNAERNAAEKVYDSSLRKARVMLVLSVVMLIVSTTLYIIKQRKEHNQKQLAIPTVIVDRDVESDITGYLAYSAVLWNRNRNDDSGRDNRADINGDAARQWLALYTTKDKAAGDPILADSIVIRTGLDKGNKAPGNDYVPLSLFGRENAQNLVDENYSFHDKVKGIWMWYRKGKETKGMTDDTLTGSNISNGGVPPILIGSVGAGVGFLLGLLCMYFYRRRKPFERD